ncbi:MAG: hypothetical protein ACK5O2_12460 [Microthrixaceae bacterium]
MPTDASGPDHDSSGPLGLLLRPSLTRQCWGFMIGSALFAIGSAPGFSDWAGATTANICYFVGAWGFTYAGFLQWVLSGPRLIPKGDLLVVSAVWLGAAAQSVGTILFNMSTSSALSARSIDAQKHFVWSPDAAGSVLFLVSGALALRAYRHRQKAWDPRSADWWSSQVNMLGCVAFGLSAVGAFIVAGGDSYDPWLASVGTFVGAICFFLASLLVLPALSSSRD